MPDHVERFRDHYLRVFGGSAYNEAIIDRFYELFLASSPEVAEKFSGTNMAVQKTMLHDSLQYMVAYLSSPNARQQVARIAAVHGRGAADIPPELYDLWLASLLQALREADPEFDDDVELAWRVMLAPGIAHMKFVHGRG